MKIEIEFSDPSIPSLAVVVSPYLSFNIANCSTGNTIKIIAIYAKTVCGDIIQETRFNPAIPFCYLSVDAAWVPQLKARAGKIYNWTYNKTWYQQEGQCYPTKESD